MGYDLESEFIQNEVGISSWEETASFNNVITNYDAFAQKEFG